MLSDFNLLVIMLLIILHINKTAGTSLRLSVDNNYNTDQRLYIYPGNCSNVNGKCIESQNDVRNLNSDQVSKLEVIMGHMSFGMHKALPQDSIRYITFVRDPVDRVLSVYYHHKTKPKSPLHPVFNKKGFGVREFLHCDLECIRSDSHPADNRMTRAISGVEIEPWGVDVSHLETAISNIHQYFEFALLTEHYEEAIDLLSSRLGWVNREKLFINVTDGKKARKEHSEEVIEEIVRMNRWDSALYEYIKKNYQLINT